MSTSSSSLLLVRTYYYNTEFSCIHDPVLNSSVFSCTATEFRVVYWFRNRTALSFQNTYCAKLLCPHIKLSCLSQSCHMSVLTPEMSCHCAALACLSTAFSFILIIINSHLPGHWYLPPPNATKPSRNTFLLRSHFNHRSWNATKKLFINKAKLQLSNVLHTICYVFPAYCLLSKCTCFIMANIYKISTSILLISKIMQ